MQIDRRWLGACFALFFSALSWAQENEGLVRQEAELIDQEPFDLITLTKAAGGESVKVLPIPFPNRVVPTDKKETERLQVILEKYQEREYEVRWRDIERIELFELRIYEQAVARMKQRDFIGAFQNLSYLMKNYGAMPQLENLRREFLIESAKARFSQGQAAQTLSALESLRDTAPDYNSQTVMGGLSRPAGMIIENYYGEGDLASAKAILSRLDKKYGSSLSVVKQWKQRLENMASEKGEEVVALMDAKQYRLARQAAVDMLRILPDSDEGKQLIRKINEIHPMVRVGVMQRCSDLDPASLTNWPARRAGGLVHAPLFRFLETGAEGGKYGFALGTYRLSDDRQQLVLSLDPSTADRMTAFELAQVIIQKATIDSPGYDPSWAAMLRSVSAPSARQVVVELNRPNVLPYALMQWMLQDRTGDSPLLPGEYSLDAQDDSETSFQLRPSDERSDQPVEIVEVFYEDPQDAVNDLLRGEIDVLDQLYPADARRLAGDRRLVVGSYALPSVHMLVPVSDEPYLQNIKFRRAMLYATNREETLRGELLNSEDSDDGKLISGPFPIGDGRTDLLAYAYDPKIAPKEYSPYLAKLLQVMAEQEVRDSFARNRKPAPKRRTLIVGSPDYELARVAVQAMIQQWAIVGIDAQMVVLPPGKMEHPEVECDLIYLITSLWEPATDIERLLGGNGIAKTDNPFVVQGLEQLRSARNWREVRVALQDLHQLVDFHLPVMPLWQITDRFAVSRYVDGLEKEPVSLYQDIPQWQIDLGFEKTAQR